MTHRDAFISRWSRLFPEQWAFEEFCESTDSLLRGHVAEDAPELKAKDSKVSELEMLLTAFLNGFDTLNRRHDEELNDIFCPLMSQTIKALKGKAAVPTNALPQETVEPKGTENT